MDSGNGIAPSQQSLHEYLLAAVPVSSCMMISFSIVPTYNVIFVFLHILLLLVYTYWLYLSTSIVLSLPFFLAFTWNSLALCCHPQTPVVPHAIEEIPLFHEDSISHKLVRLFHGIT